MLLLDTARMQQGTHVPSPPARAKSPGQGSLLENRTVTRGFVFVFGNCLSRCLTNKMWIMCVLLGSKFS